MENNNKIQLLVDGDIYAYSTSAVFQEENPFDKEGEPIFNQHAAEIVIESRLQELKDRFCTDNMRVFFSCPRKTNWRRKLNPTYKEHRENTVPPIGLNHLKGFMFSNYECFIEPTLEADDYISIVANEDPDTSIICSWDKDFLTVPTMIYNSRNKSVIKQSKKGALDFLLYQIMVGDQADGYKGAKGIGDVKAHKILKTLKESVLKKGEHTDTIINYLTDVVFKDDQSYVELQFKMAYLLRDNDYSFKTKSVRTPSFDELNKLLTESYEMYSFII